MVSRESPLVNSSVRIRVRTEFMVKVRGRVRVNPNKETSPGRTFLRNCGNSPRTLTDKLNKKN